MTRKLHKMRKATTFIGLLFLVIGTLQSQNYEEDVRRFYGGAQVGFNLPAIVNQNNYGYSELDYMVKTSMSFGLHAGLDIHNKHMIQIGVQYSQLGQDYKDVIGNVDNEKQVDLGYLHIPVTYKWGLDDERGFAYDKLNKYLLGGVQLGLLTSAENSWFIEGGEVELLDFINQRGFNENYAQILQDQADFSDDKELYQSLDVNILFGGGFQYFKTETLQFYFEFVGGVGVTDINAQDWRYLNNKGVYRASLNAFGSIRIGANYYLKRAF